MPTDASHLNGLFPELATRGNCLVRDFPHPRLLLHLVVAPDPRCVLGIERLRITHLSRPSPQLLEKLGRRHSLRLLVVGLLFLRLR